MTPTSLPNNPIPPRLRVEGLLTSVEATENRFLLQLPDGRKLPGILVGRPIAGLARLLGRPLIVFGTERPGTNGQPQEIEADGFVPDDGKLWVMTSEDLPLTAEVAAVLASRQQAARGQWPGDETDEEIERALKELG